MLDDMQGIGPILEAGFGAAVSVLAGGWVGAAAFIAAIVVREVGRHVRPVAVGVAPTVDKDTRV